MLLQSYGCKSKQFGRLQRQWPKCTHELSKSARHTYRTKGEPMFWKQPTKQIGNGNNIWTISYGSKWSNPCQQGHRNRLRLHQAGTCLVLQRLVALEVVGFSGQHQRLPRREVCSVRPQRPPQVVGFLDQRQPPPHREVCSVQLQLQLLPQEEVYLGRLQLQQVVCSGQHRLLHLVVIYLGQHQLLHLLVAFRLEERQLLLLLPSALPQLLLRLLLEALVV